MSISEESKGLWANIRAKRARGGKPARKGSEAYKKAVAAAKKINAMRIKFPKPVSNKVTKRFGIANITTHNTSNNVIKPTTKLRFFLENTSETKNVIYII